MGQYTLGDVFAFVLQVNVGVHFLDFGRPCPPHQDLLPQTLDLLVDQQKNPFLQLLVHLLAATHISDVVATIFFLQEDIDDVDQVLQHFVHYSSQRNVPQGRREGLQ